MKVWIIEETPEKIAQSLDDKSLDKQIKDIANLLCGVHQAQIIHEFNQMNDFEQSHFQRALQENLEKIPLRPTINNAWSQWASKCKANYLWLVELGLACCREWQYRFSTRDELIDFHSFKKPPTTYWQYWDEHKLQITINCCAEHVPDLPSKLDCNNLPTIDTDPNLFPLVMPKKYQFIGSVLTYNWYVIDSYRRYYKEKLYQKCKACRGKGFSNCGCCDVCYTCEGNKKIFSGCWTRTDKPDWL